jgi:hypothetical protein
MKNKCEYGCCTFPKDFPKEKIWCAGGNGLSINKPIVEKELNRLPARRRG